MTAAIAVRSPSEPRALADSRPTRPDRPLGLRPGSDQPRLYDALVAALRTRHYSLSTEQAYVGWIRRYILFHQKRHPLEMGKAQVGEFLTHLAVKEHVASSTQNQALAALLFLYRQVLERDFGWLDDVVRAKRPKRLPVVFTPEEASRVLAELTGVRWLIGMNLYGGGLRVMECLRLRVQDLDFERLQTTIRDVKGAKDRVTLLPRVVVEPLKDHLRRVREWHERALREGYGGVELPYALARKYPRAGYEWGWQYLFPAAQPSLDPRSGARRRHHLFRSYIQTAVSAALRKLGINKHAGCHTFRHSFATSRRAGTRGWRRYPYRPGADGSQGRAHHPDLHPRCQAQRLCGQQSSRQDDVACGPRRDAR